ncbi:MAG: DUF2784 domain-containing protein [Xanthomonadales bacterium]
MSYALAANLVFLLHLGFIVFVVLGGLLVMRWPRIALLHLPCAAWGAAIEFGGWVCPLTPLEWRLRELAGEAVAAGGFIERYLWPLVYPAGLTRDMQYALGAAVIALNVVFYAMALRRHRRRR